MEVRSMTKGLFFGAIGKFLLGLVLVGTLIFLPAGTLRFFGGWLLMGILFIPMFCAGLVMMAKNPELLKKRLNAKEKEAEQTLVVKLSGLMFILGFVLAGLDFRYGWLPLPPWVNIAAAILFLIAYILYAEVLRENTYLSRTIEVQQGQKVIDTGLYGIVRHPMYSATLLLFLSMPLVLGSAVSFMVFLVYPLIISKRIRNEEQVLAEGLEGYKAYMQKVKYRLIPYIW
jgi:protein-S-isoprenylcysteine O-methyltransferase Ste14